jgi:membrane protease YdiL (CAAX protease family)
VKPSGAGNGNADEESEAIVSTAQLLRTTELDNSAGGRRTDRASRRDELVELGVFLLLIVPSMALSFFAVAQGQLPFPLVAFATISRDLGLVALIFFFLYRNGERPAALGWTGRHAGREIALGIGLFVPLFVGAQVLETALRSAGLSGPLSPAPNLVPVPDIAELLLAIVLVAVVAVSEEIIFRGYLLLRFSHLLPGLGGAVLLSAVVFSIGHGYEGTAGVVTVGVTGLMLALVYLWRRSLVAPMVMHFLLDFVAIVLVPLLK